MPLLPEAFLEALRQATPMRELVGRTVPLKRQGHQWVGCCPFHGEKTASFYVYETPNPHYHCFGCGEHGDAIAFVMKAEGAGFRETVERLASEAGLEVPKTEGAAAEAEDRRSVLLRVLAAAAEDWRCRLWSADGAKALAYLRARELTDETIKSWGLGWSGSGRAIERDLGVNLACLGAAGLARVDEDGKPAGALFFDRVMFPIRDRRGVVIGFSGRRLDDGRPKYLNGPETEVFSKRRVLYGIDAATAAARGGETVVAVEGMTDVLMAHQGGACGACAALGTSLTEDHLRELWRLSPAPVLCFDGDAAGLRAVKRATELALPFVTPEQVLRVATLPSGDDPDTMIRRDGVVAWRGLLDQSASLVEALFLALRRDADLASPEGRAALAGRLDDSAARVRHRALSWQYRVELRRLFSGSRRFSAGVVDRTVPHADTIASENARILVATVIRHPWLLLQAERAFIELDLPAPWCSVHGAILEHLDALSPDELVEALRSAGLAGFVEQALAEHPVPLPSFARADAGRDQVIDGWQRVHALMLCPSLDEQIDAVMLDFAADPSERTQQRIFELCAHRSALRAGEMV